VRLRDRDAACCRCRCARLQARRASRAHHSAPLPPLLQDLVFRAARASSPKPSPRSRAVLAPFVEKKGRGATPAAEALTFRTHSAILTRALVAANPALARERGPAPLAAFPVTDPGAPSARDAEAGVQRQFDALSALLRDDCLAVREVAVQVRARGRAFRVTNATHVRVPSLQGVARVLNVYWETIPVATSRAFVECMTAQLPTRAPPPCAPPCPQPSPSC